MQNRTFIHRLIFSSKDLFVVTAVLSDLEVTTMEMSPSHPTPLPVLCLLSRHTTLSPHPQGDSTHTGRHRCCSGNTKFSMEPSVGFLPQHGLKLPRMVVANSIYSPPTWHVALSLNTSESNNVKRISKQVGFFTSNK